MVTKTQSDEGFYPAKGETNSTMEMAMDTVPISALEQELIIDQAIAQLEKANLRSPARRLQSLSEMINDETQVGKLANINVYGVFDPAEIERRAAETALRQYSTLYSGLEWVRNVLVLVPITLTWFSFWLAAQDYGALLKKNPNLSGESFLYLWETGFAEKAAVPFLTFSQTALLAAFVLLVIIFLTILVHYRKDVATTRATNLAARVRSDLEDALWVIEKALSSKRRTDTEAGIAEELAQAVKQFNTNSDRMTRAVSQMDGGAREWMNLTKELDLRLGMVVGQMKDEADGLRVFSNGLTGNVDRMFRHLESANQTSTQLAAAVEKLSSAIEANTVVQEDKLNDIAAQLNVLEEQARGWGQALRKTTDDLRLAVDKSSSSVAGVAGAVTSVTALLKGQDELRQTIKSFEQTLSTSIAESRGDGVSLAATQLRASLDTLSRTYAEFGGEQVNLLAQIKNEMSQMMRTFINEQANTAQLLRQGPRLGGLQFGSAPVEAQIKVVPLAFAIGASVVVSSIIVVGALFLMMRMFSP